MVKLIPAISVTSGASQMVATVRQHLAGVVICVLLVVAQNPVSANENSVRFTQDLVDHLAQLPVIRGDAVTDADLSGKVIVVTFFASWCPPCRKEFEHLNSLKAEHPESELRIIAINVFEQFLDNKEPTLTKFLDFTSPTFSVLEGNADTRALFGQVKRIPTLFVFTPKGEAVTHFIHKSGATKQTVGLAELQDAVARAK